MGLSLLRMAACANAAVISCVISITGFMPSGRCIVVQPCQQGSLLLCRSFGISFDTSAYLHHGELATVGLCHFFDAQGAHDVWGPWTEILKSQRASTFTVAGH